MKKLYYLLFILIVAASCSRDGAPGPQGIPGNQGPRGNDGLDGQTTYVFDFDFNFNAENEYTEFIGDEEGFSLYQDEMALVYLLWETSEEFGDVWRLMPQSQMMEFGWVQYNYDFTQNDLSIFLESDFPLNNLGPVYTEGWVRVVIIPSEFTENGRQLNVVDYTDYHAVLEAYNIPDKPLPEGYKVPRRF